MKYKLTISEYGKQVREYADNDKQRFLEESQKLVIEHLTKHSFQQQGDVKNVTIHYATYE